MNIDNTNSLSEPISVVNIEDLMKKEFPPIDWIVQDIICPGLIVLAGPPKVGKSWLVLQMALSIAHGKDFIGKKTSKGKVLYMALEDNLRRLQRRILKQGYSNPKDVDFLNVQTFIDLKNPDETISSKLQEFISVSGYKLIILDTFSRGFHVNQNKGHEVSRILDPLQKISMEHDLAIIVVDHHRKSNAQTSATTTSEVAGSKDKTAIADAIINLVRIGKRRRGKLSGGGRDIEDFEYDLIFSKTNCLWSFDSDSKEDKFTDNELKILDILKEESNISQTELCNKTGIGKSNISKILKNLIEEKIIFSKREGRKKLYSITPKETIITDTTKE